MQVLLFVVAIASAFLTEILGEIITKRIVSADAVL